ncbi:hypothetical protein BH24ACT26_BH24ACT26_22630 [soil metagenome]
MDTPNPYGSYGSFVASEWRRRLATARRRRWKVIPWLTLYALLAGVGVMVASLGQTRVAEAPAFQNAGEEAGRRASADEADERVQSSSPDAGNVEPSSQSRTVAEATAPMPQTKLITQGVTVQVLNGTRTARADDRMVDRMVDLGFAVLAVNQAATRYDETTVFWSRASGREAAQTLAKRFGWRAARKPGNLSASVTTHVVVGRDEA